MARTNRVIIYIIEGGRAMTEAREKLIRDIMTKDLVTVEETDSVENCANILAKHNLGGLPVVNSMGVLKGIVTEGDLIRRITKVNAPAYVEILGGIFYLETARELMEDMQKVSGNLVKDVMTEDVFTIGPKESIEDGATLMVKKKIKRLPVVHKGELVGIVSRKDIMHYLFYKEDK